MCNSFGRISIPFPTVLPVGLFPINHNVSCLYCQFTFCTGPLSALIHNRLFLVGVFSSGGCCYFPVSFRLLTELGALLSVGQGHSQLLEATHPSCHLLPPIFKARNGKIFLMLSYPSYFVSTERSSLFKLSSN